MLGLVAMVSLPWPLVIMNADLCPTGSPTQDLDLAASLTTNTLEGTQIAFVWLHYGVRVLFIGAIICDNLNLIKYIPEKLVRVLWNIS
jgi:hypothetical protein